MKRGRVQSAVNTRAREVAEAKKEKEEMDEEARRYEVELEQVRKRNDEIRLMIQQKREN